LCYEGDRFIGTPLLVLVVEKLKTQYNIIIIFDTSTVRGKLSTNSLALKRRFPQDVRIHVIAGGATADETILDLASRNDKTYVLSNDSFSAYKEKEVIQHDRRIRYQLVEGNIFIRDLSITVLQEEYVEKNLSPDDKLERLLADLL